MQTSDFSQSYLHFSVDMRKPAASVTRPQPVTVNQVRIPLESRCVISDSGRSTSYVLGASCKTELVNVKRDMWTLPNADFCVVVSDEDFLIIKRWERHDRKVETMPSMAPPVERQHGKARDVWASHHVDLPQEEARVLDDVAQIIDATGRNRPLVCQTEIKSASGGRALIEYPVKTINVSDLDGYYQVDTGPVLLPDLSATGEPITTFQLAYVAHNGPDWAEFIVNAPTSITDDISVPHYSKPVGIEVANRVLELL